MKGWNQPSALLCSARLYDQVFCTFPSCWRGSDPGVCSGVTAITSADCTQWHTVSCVL